MGIVKIADEVLKKDKGIKFLLIGKSGYGGRQLLKEIRKRKNIVYIKSVDDQLLKKIYNLASIFLFPSYYEGFGFPPLEAMQSGLPVLAADNTSLKEIINSGGLLHDADDYVSFSEDIIHLLNDEFFYSNQKERGIERAKKFKITSTTLEFVKHFNSFKLPLQ